MISQRKFRYLFGTLPLLNIAFSACYFFLAQFGLAWSSLTSNVTLVWPAAGLALFCMLKFGLRAAPGLVIGSMAATQLLHFDEAVGRSATTLLAATLMSSADLLQAWIITRLNPGLFNRSFIINTRQALYFIASVFLCCTISSALGVQILNYLGIVTSSDIAKSWVFWWMGDSIGMLIFAPLLAWSFIPRARKTNSQAQAFLLLCAGVGIVLFLVSIIGHTEHSAKALTAPSQQLADPWYIPSLLQSSVFIVGLLLIGLLTAYLNARQQHDALIAETQQNLENEIIARTKELRDSNDQLLKEIGERKTAQEALENFQNELKQREQQLRDLLNNLPDPIWLKRLDGNYINCNRAFAHLFGKAEQDVIGKSEMDLFPAEQAVKFLNSDVKALNSNMHRYEEWMALADGSLRLMDTRKVVLRNQQDDAYAILGISRDITEKYQLIDELQKFKRFAEFSSQGFGIANLYGETLYMNPAMRHMLNDYLLDSNFKQKFWLYYPEELQATVRDEIIPDVIAQGRWQGELAALHADGSSFPTQETFFVIRDDHGKAQYIGNVMSDITAQKEAENALSLAKEAAETATNAKSRFLANMSHEIRTPLNAVLGYTQLLMRDDNFTGNQRERLQLILTASQRLLGLINDILDLSKIESGLLNLRQDYFDLQQEIIDIHTILLERAQSKGLQFLLDVDLPVPSLVKGDRQKIGQILLNLLGNAIKFTAAGSVSLRVTRQQDNVNFVITDTGPGIAPDELKQLFSAFKQGQAGADIGGTGLGLTLSRYLAEGMGGSLQLSSEPGQGTQALLRLPLPGETIVKPINSAPKVQRLQTGCQCRALVVEDDLASKDVLVNLLAQIGCDIHSANNGREGLALCREHTFDIIFTDIRMPDMNGIEMLKHIRSEPAYATIPIIAVSASSLEHERNYYLAQGFQDFIGKPYAFDEIFTALHQHAQINFDSDALTAETPNTESMADDTTLDLTPVTLQLERLLAAATSGDMTEVKQWFNNLHEHNLGAQRYQKLTLAIRQYDLERVETLVRKFLEEIL